MPEGRNAPATQRRRRAPPPANAPTIAPQSRPTFTLAVLQFLRAELTSSPTLPIEGLGWKAVQALWGLLPPHFDPVVLSHLALKPPPLQQQILLAFATANIATVQNPSGFLMRVLQTLEVGKPVCLLYLAGGCPRDSNCPFLHPGFSRGWQTLWTRWRARLEDFDYLVLNALFQQPVEQQNRILWRLASMRLKSVKNASALLSSIIQQAEQDPLRSMTQPTPLPVRLPDTLPASTPDQCPSVSSSSCGAPDPPPADPPRAVIPADVLRATPSEGAEGRPRDEVYWNPEFTRRLEMLQRVLCELLQDARQAGLDVDMDLMREALPGLV
eukprot:EG_transcript_18128